MLRCGMTTIITHAHLHLRTHATCGVAAAAAATRACPRARSPPHRHCTAAPPPPLQMMAQPPYDEKLAPFYILHYTYGMDYTLEGVFTPGTCPAARRASPRASPDGSDAAEARAVPPPPLHTGSTNRHSGGAAKRQPGSGLPRGSRALLPRFRSRCPALMPPTPLRLTSLQASMASGGLTSAATGRCRPRET